MSAIEIFLLKRTEPIYRYYPWKLLIKSGVKGVAESEYGRALMEKMMVYYNDQKQRFAKLVGHGYRMLADAIEADLPYEIKCPALLICSEKDNFTYCIAKTFLLRSLMVLYKARKESFL